MFRIEHGTAGWEARTLPLCYAIPRTTHGPRCFVSYSIATAVVIIIGEARTVLLNRSLTWEEAESEDAAAAAFDDKSPFIRFAVDR